MSRSLATIIGFSAVLMWALLALFTAASGSVPPFQLTAMSFFVGGSLGLVSWIWRPEAWAAIRQPWQVYLFGTVGLFGYHFFYFTALRAAPPVEAGLIAYLWPLLIVLFSALLPGERLRWFHLAGAVMGLAGSALIVTGGKGFDLNSDYVGGYAAALLCALIWSGYSVLSRRLPHVPTDAVTGFCYLTALLSFCAHLMLEQTVWPDALTEWLAVLGLGLLPVGAAFYAWDLGVKRGDIQVLGAASYAAPLLSTLVLLMAGFGTLTTSLVLACLLITGGAALAAKDMIGRKD
ncbi:aromatic amino acid exporter YddG [Coralliovum pocilloporae]|uniref:aromatic amino acid exporter YddG n=1 Tax=Coralliovum pocilloporae TaxID=3066369 RepID=UPI0033070E11